MTNEEIDKMLSDHREQSKEIASMTKKKVVWLNISIEVEGVDLDDDAAMDYANDLAVEAGFVVDDMGVVSVNPADVILTACKD